MSDWNFHFTVLNQRFNLSFEEHPRLSINQVDGGHGLSIPLPGLNYLKSVVDLFIWIWNGPIGDTVPEITGLSESDIVGLRTLLPSRFMTFQLQYNTFMNSYQLLVEKVKGEPEVVVSSEKLKILNVLHDNNETLYYRVLIENLKELASIVYTPTVGLVCQDLSVMFRQSRGMLLNAEDQGKINRIITNLSAQQVDIFVLTDGSNVLSQGDLGVAVGMPVGKFDMYVAAAGLNPQMILQVMLDLGTNNKLLRENIVYSGLRQPRLEGEQFRSILDEFMEAVHGRWPKAIFQFEEFEMSSETLEYYCTKFCMFNHDIQGTAGVALAGILGAVALQDKKRELTNIVNQRMVVFGATSAGISILKLASLAASRIAGREVQLQYFLVDEHGLITDGRENTDAYVAPFSMDIADANRVGLREGATLLDVVLTVKPHVLVGLSRVGGIFTEEVLKAMRVSGHKRPVIFAISSPCKDAECSAEDAFKHAGENIIFGSGSQYRNVDLGNNNVGYVNQMHNIYFFPGIVSGAIISGARLISDSMLVAAACRLASFMTCSYLTTEDIERGILFPPSTPSTKWVRRIASEIAAATIKEAINENLAQGSEGMSLNALNQMSEEQLARHVEQTMWNPPEWY